MKKLVPYNKIYEKELLKRIITFDDHHFSLVNQKERSEDELVKQQLECLETLNKWTEQPNEMFMILENEEVVGFVQLFCSNQMVARIENIFVDEGHRGKGLGTFAILEVENVIRNMAEYQAVTMEVSLRNHAALKLYHKLGFVDLSMITVRKEFGESKRDRSIELFGLDFNY